MSTKIGIISDTHGMLRPEVIEVLKSCGCIIHGGDINNQKIMDELQSMARLYVVRGNNDKEWAEYLPHDLRFNIEGVNFYLVHNKKEVPEELGDTNVVIFGHSHKYAESKIEGRLWLNPGSCGKRRFHQEISFAVMEAEGGIYKVEKIVVEQKMQ